MSITKSLIHTNTTTNFTTFPARLSEMGLVGQGRSGARGESEEK